MYIITFIFIAFLVENYILLLYDWIIFSLTPSQTPVWEALIYEKPSVTSL